MKRLLCILSCMNAGGAETFLMKILRTIDRSSYMLDFCINIPEKNFYEDEIIGLGGRIYRIPAKSADFSGYKKALTRVIKENSYQYVLRITSSAAGFMDLKIAKKAGAKVCCARSSNSSDGGGLKAWFAHRIGRVLYGRYIDVMIAPSDLAAEYTFGKKAYRNGNVKILKNGLNLNSFRYDEAARNAIRKELWISEDAFVVGHVGRFSPQKNHSFLLDVFAEIKKKNKNAVLLLVGTGRLMDEIQEKADRLNLTDSVVFSGVRSDVPQILSAMDVFVFPSLYEGMPNTVLEAQAAGLQCFVSDTITSEANVTGQVEYLPLSSNAATWAERIRIYKGRARNYSSEIMCEKGYGIEDTAEHFISYVFKNSD